MRSLGSLASSSRRVVAAVRGDAVLHMPAVPDDGVDFGFDALQGLGEFGHELRATQGELVGEGGGTAQQAVPLHRSS